MSHTGLSGPCFQTPVSSKRPVSGKIWPRCHIQLPMLFALLEAGSHTPVVSIMSLDHDFFRGLAQIVIRAHDVAISARIGNQQYVALGARRE